MKFWDGMTDKANIKNTDFLMISEDSTDKPQRVTVQQLVDFKGVPTNVFAKGYLEMTANQLANAELGEFYIPGSYGIKTNVEPIVGIGTIFTLLVDYAAENIVNGLRHTLITATGQRFTRFGAYNVVAEGYVFSDFSSAVTASAFSVPGGTSSQFLKANGTVDGEVYTPSRNRTNWKNVVDANVVGQLGWSIYGNGHTIFDASSGLSPDGTVVDANLPLFTETPGRPNIMGWNGVGTFGVRVDEAHHIDGVRLQEVWSGGSWNRIPYIKSEGVLEIGKYLDFHNTANDGIDYAVRLFSDNGFLNSTGALKLPSGNMFGGSVAPDSSYSIFGDDVTNKVIVGHYGGTTNGATVGSVSTGINSWTPLNINGSVVNVRVNEAVVGQFTSGGISMNGWVKASGFVDSANNEYSVIPSEDTRLNYLQVDSGIDITDGTFIYRNHSYPEMHPTAPIGTWLFDESAIYIKTSDGWKKSNLVSY